MYGSEGEVMSVWPGALIGGLKFFTSIVPSGIPWYVATALTLRRLIDAVNGLARLNVDAAIPPWPSLAMSRGNTRAAWMMRFWWSGGIVVASWIEPSASWRDLIGVVLDEPTMSVSDTIPCTKFSRRTLPTAVAEPLGW